MHTGKQRKVHCGCSWFCFCRGILIPLVVLDFFCCPLDFYQILKYSLLACVNSLGKSQFVDNMEL